MRTATSPLTSEELEFQRVAITAEEATQLRHYASRGGWQMPVSRLERDLYAARGLEPPQ